MVRRAPYQAANVFIHATKRWCAPKSWAVRVARRRGLAKANATLARKLSVVLHRLWTSGESHRAKAPWFSPRSGTRSLRLADHNRVPRGPSGDGAGMSAASPLAVRLSSAGI
jgi:hypothetical protein